MKRFLILGATLLASVSTAQAIECASQKPADRSGHWYYRIIDGRKCWYEGQKMLPKSLLHWPDQSLSDGQTKMPATDGRNFRDSEDGPSLSDVQAKMPATDGQNVLDPEDGSCCWPPLGEDNSFESRWRALGLKPGN